jgi:hypothetical protein
MDTHSTDQRPRCRATSHDAQVKAATRPGEQEVTHEAGRLTAWQDTKMKAHSAYTGLIERLQRTAEAMQRDSTRLPHTLGSLTTVELSTMARVLEGLNSAAAAMAFCCSGYVGAQLLSYSFWDETNYVHYP